MANVTKKISCLDGSDRQCKEYLDIVLDLNDYIEGQSLMDYAEETGQDTVCSYCGSDRTYHD